MLRNGVLTNTNQKLNIQQLKCCTKPASVTWSCCMHLAAIKSSSGTRCTKTMVSVWEYCNELLHFDCFMRLVKLTKGCYLDSTLSFMQSTFTSEVFQDLIQTRDKVHGPERVRPSWRHPLGFSDIRSILNYHLPHSCFMSHPPHPYWSELRNNVWWWVIIVKYLIVKFIFLKGNKNWPTYQPHPIRHYFGSYKKMVLESLYAFCSYFTCKTEAP